MTSPNLTETVPQEEMIPVEEMPLHSEQEVEAMLANLMTDPFALLGTDLDQFEDALHLTAVPSEQDYEEAE